MTKRKEVPFRNNPGIYKVFRYDKSYGKKLMGHSSPNVTLKYVAQTTVQKQKVADALDSVLKAPKKDDTPPPVPQCPALSEQPRLRLIKSDGSH